MTDVEADSARRRLLGRLEELEATHASCYAVLKSLKKAPNFFAFAFSLALFKSNEGGVGVK